MGLEGVLAEVVLQPDQLRLFQEIPVAQVDLSHQVLPLPMVVAATLEDLILTVVLEPIRLAIFLAEVVAVLEVQAQLLGAMVVLEVFQGAAELEVALGMA